MEKFIDSNICLSPGGFDVSDIKFSNPVPIRTKLNSGIERIVPIYDSGYLQFEFEKVIFPRGIPKLLESDNSCVRDVTIDAFRLESETENIIQKIEEFIRDRFDYFSNSIITKTDSHSVIIAEYFDCPEGKTQLIDANNKPIELELLIDRKFQGFPVLRFLLDCIDEKNYMIKIIIVSIKVTDIMIPVIPRIHQRNIGEKERALLEEKLNNLRNVLSPKQEEEKIKLQNNNEVREKPKAYKTIKEDRVEKNGYYITPERPLNPKTKN